MAFADILNKISESTDRASLEAMAAKYPNLRSLVESGEVFEGARERFKSASAKVDGEFRDYEANPAALVDELERWRGFGDKDWKNYQREQARLQEALRTAENKIQNLESLRGTDMEPDEVRQIVTDVLKGMGLATSADVQSAIDKAVAEKVNPTVQSTVNGLTSRFEDVFDKIDVVLDSHRHEFPDDKIRPKQVFDYMRENKIADPEAAYKAMTASKYAEKSQAQREAEKKAEYDKGVAEGRKQAAAGRANPVDGSGGASPQGALMRRAEARRAARKDQPANNRLGSMTAARAGVEEYRQKLEGSTAA